MSKPMASNPAPKCTKAISIAIREAMSAVVIGNERGIDEATDEQATPENSEHRLSEPVSTRLWHAVIERNQATDRNTCVPIEQPQ